MSKSQSELMIANTKAVAQTEMDLGIVAIDSAVLRLPYGSVSMNLGETRSVVSVDGVAMRLPYGSMSMNLGATRTLFAI